MTPRHSLLLALACCVAVLWLAGPLPRVAVLLPLLLFAPGLMLAGVLRLELPPTLAARPAVWLALSISVVALAYQWATALGLALHAPVLAVIGVLVVAGAGWQIWHDQTVMPARASLFAPLVLAGILVLALVLRFMQIGGLALPMWVDSVHHALLIRVAIERGQAPYGLEPYVPIAHVGYHWGYHVLIATLAQLGNLDIPSAMLWGGQALNGLHVLTCAALAAALWRRPVAGVAAALVVGLVSLMPAYYLSWGRYTHLTGLLLLPPAAIVWQALLQRPRRGAAVALALLLAGLNIVHFRVLVFTLLLLLAQTVVWASTQSWRTTVDRLRWAAMIGAAAVLGSAPWIYELALARLRPLLSLPGYLDSTGGTEYINWGILWAGQNRLLAALALGGALLGVRRRTPAVITIVVWLASMLLPANPTLLLYLLPALAVPVLAWAVSAHRWRWALAGGLLLLCNPFFLRVPSSWLITNDSIAISLFVPFAVLIGGLAVLGGNALGRWPVVRYAATAAAFGGALVWGTVIQQPANGVVNNRTLIATAADRAAIDWIAANTPPDARFLINATGWLPGANRGTDGGWWILPLAGRWVSTPPVLFLNGPAEYVNHAVAVSDQVATFRSGEEAALMNMIHNEGIGYIYLSDRGTPLKPELFAPITNMTKVYDHDGVTILAVRAQS